MKQNDKFSDDKIMAAMVTVFLAFTMIFLFLKTIFF